MKLTESTVLLVTVASVIVAGLAIGYMVSGALAEEHETNSSTQSAYDLNLVVTTNNYYNATVGAQPAYFVLGPSGPESSTNITLPAFTQIDLTIFNYDDGNGTLAPQYGNVTGTVGNVITYFNDTLMNSTYYNNSIAVNGSVTASSVPLDFIAHTFTITTTSGKVLVNIPVPISSVVHATFYINETGSFLWQCEVACGSGPTGWGGAMATPGWMAGYVYVKL